MNKMLNGKLKQLFAGAVLSAALIMAALPAAAQSGSAPSRILINNVRIFDGTSKDLSDQTSVLIVGNKIEKIGAGATAGDGAMVIDGGGRVLMPGIIEGHAHVSFQSLDQFDLFYGLPSYQQLRAGVDAKNMLMRGVTSARDMGGAVFGLKRAIDEGYIVGPRIYPSGAPLSQTSGHGDFRAPGDLHPDFGGAQPNFVRNGNAIIADGVAQVQAAAREQLRKGASQIKMLAGGGYASPADPIDVTQYSLEELKAGVGVAADWGTYVTVHAYTPRAVNRDIDAGVKVIEHGQLLDEATLKHMADEGVWLSTQPFTTCHEDQLDAFSNEKLAVVCEGTKHMYAMIAKMPELKVVWGTDIFMAPGVADGEVKQLERLLPWFTPAQILKMATGNAGELLKLSGPRNPYPGDLGFVKEGAYADLLLVDGNPLEDLGAVTNEDNLKIIMKDGKIYKNTL